MIDDPIDFSPLDPSRDSPKFDARVTAIARDAAVPPPADLLVVLAAWARPALAAAAIIAAVALYPLLRHPSPRGVTTAEILGVPSAVVELARSSTPPGVVDLVEALNAEASHVR